MSERLQKILSARGIASRRAAEKMIADGRVSVNGTVACLGQTADPDHDEILLDGKPLPVTADTVYIMLHKPRGFVTTMSDEKGRRTAFDLVADCGLRVEHRLYVADGVCEACRAAAAREEAGG